MIQSFGDKETERIFNQEFSRKIAPDIQSRALIKLLLLENAEREEDLRIPPSNNFEHLKGDKKEFCSIRINKQWRIVFRFSQGHCFDVSIVDYH
ncbi:plasmid maintenance system killer protein [Leptospira kmetyi]|uniref:Plasmid maintenance system killer protein n=1 Tax=Leptospira yasudae TaxID=2202201 RepID=A0ABX9M0H9_9LEPT|nr:MULTISPECIES: type II toxin-antitoxin system RelE/ParE family toxin [Leptospira]MBW0435455.1 type II toxin-antitoxin system RelE/ParE family toxin [Leptospira yasudae]PJZ41707.1 plasmid maintenance system killer protein [Leptospira kmetyi]RHX78773.1 plasmid maintenance system killer protein [Leptospira yasudae]